MKLLIITAIEEFEKEIKTILKDSGVKVFSYQKLNGFKDLSEETFKSNWFASDMNENNSLMFYAFTPKENVDKVFENIDLFNAAQKTMSNIHVALINIERSN